MEPEAGFHAEKITVYRDGLSCCIRSYYSPELDIVRRISDYGSESAWLLPKGADIRQYDAYFCLHRTGDEYPATILDGYGPLSGNHGSAFLRRVKVPGHGFSAADTGKALRDGKGNIWRLVCDPATLLKDELLIHPDNRGTDGRPDFPSSAGKVLRRPDGQPLKIVSEKSGQMYPTNRITVCEFLLDGKEVLPEKEVRECAFLEYRFFHDVLSPGSLMRFLAENPGPEHSRFFTQEWSMMFADRAPGWYNRIPALMTVENRYRFQIHGAQVLERTTTWHAAGISGKQLEQMYPWKGGIAPRVDDGGYNGKYFDDAVEDLYIPKVKKIRFLDTEDPQKTLSFDFRRIASLPHVLNAGYYFTAKDCLDPADPPDRFVMLTGRGKYQYGLALGYSLFDGCTARGGRKAEREVMYHLYSSKKLYPYAYQVSNAAPGTKVRTISYKQYFDPAADPDIPVMYLHKELDSWVLYMGFFRKMPHKTVKLPQFLTGQKITVLEKTSSVKPGFSGVAEKEGISFQSGDDCGYLVLKFDRP